MGSLVTEFIEVMNEKTHLRKLFRDSTFSLCIKAGNKEIPLTFHDGNSSVKIASQHQSFDATISGSEEIIHSILEGEQKLRDAVKGKDVATDATFRRLLFLESLFLLCKN
ncbi:hypothetical protein F7731_13450 [Cytobacillus depressus]|uniref:SCP2 sterol-binding domain-containing protein n=1 Tax=Cytobacillus depressus TaxID=1602942 RepID=A0A6L3V3X1_9BACI|nr:hypothetical protein [Cytobacillus depressus]KAB2334768.1 hypothetical protein F7731_13450 [Cytobacillus depressus]